jgi:hypothetical protein
MAILSGLHDLLRELKDFATALEFINSKSQILIKKIAFLQISLKLTGRLNVIYKTSQLEHPWRLSLSSPDAKRHQKLT